MPILIAKVVTRAVEGEAKAVACFAAALLALLAAFFPIVAAHLSRFNSAHGSVAF